MSSEEKARRIARAILRRTATPYEMRLARLELERIEAEEREAEEREAEVEEIYRHYQAELAGDGTV